MQHIVPVPTGYLYHKLFFTYPIEIATCSGLLQISESDFGSDKNDHDCTLRINLNQIVLI